MDHAKLRISRVHANLIEQRDPESVQVNSTSRVTPNSRGRNLKLRGYVHKVSNPLPVHDPACSRSALLTTSSWLRRDRVRERGETKRMLEKELKVLGVAERAVKRIACTLQCASSAWLSGFLFSILGGYGGKPRIGAVPCCAGPCPCRCRNPG